MISRKFLYYPPPLPNIPVKLEPGVICLVFFFGTLAAIPFLPLSQPSIPVRYLSSLENPSYIPLDPIKVALSFNSTLVFTV